MALLALTLAGCGGGGGPDPFPSHFNTEVVWQADIPAAGQSTCFDFDAGSEVPTCLGNAWDLKITGRQGDAPMLFTNSGSSGTGQGGVYARRAANGTIQQVLMKWFHLEQWKDGATNPANREPLPADVYVADANGSLLNVPATLRGLDEDHGWFIKYTDAQRAQAAGFAPLAGVLGADPERGALIRGGEGNNYARMRLKRVSYQDPKNVNSAQRWTIQFYAQLPGR